MKKPHIPKAVRWIGGVAIALGAVFALVFLTPTPNADKIPERVKNPKQFGVVIDPWNVDRFEARFGRPDLVMQFEAFSQARTIERQFEQARAAGLRSYMVTWEPWKPVEATKGIGAQAVGQPGYSNAAIASGAHDAYIREWARSIKGSGLTVYLRYAHEVNAKWYPWSKDPKAYVRAWRHIHKVFEEEKVSNARWVYSVALLSYETNAKWQSSFWRYWPGGKYVDMVGMTVINFGGTRCTAFPCPRDHSGIYPRLVGQRLLAMHKLTGKPVWITELNTAHAERGPWLEELRTWMLQGTDWLRGFVLSQAPSRAQAQSDTGLLNWNVLNDELARLKLKALLDVVT